MSLGEKIYLLRKKSGMSQDELAEKMDEVPPKTAEGFFLRNKKKIPC